MFKFIFNLFNRNRKNKNNSTSIYNDNSTFIYNDKKFVITTDEKQSMIDWVEEYLFDCGIDLSNVFIHDLSKNGKVCKVKKNGFKLNIDGVYFSNHYPKDTDVMILPEICKNYNSIDFFYTLSVWIHEIAHFIFKHNDDYIGSKTQHEYEACLYSEKILEKMPIFVQFIYTDADEFDIDIRIRELLMKYVKIHNSSYVKSYYEKPDFKNRFLNKEVIEYAKREF